MLEIGIANMEGASSSGARRRIPIIACMAVIVSATSSYADTSQFDGLRNLLERKSLLEEETKEVQTAIEENEVEITNLRETADGLQKRLDALGDPPDIGSQQDPTIPTPPTPAVQEDSPELRQKQMEVAQAVSDRIVLLESGRKPLGTAFFAMHDGGIKILTAAELVSGHAEIAILTADGKPIPTTGQITSPTGVGVVCLHPEKSDFPSLEVVNPGELPPVGGQVVVVALETGAQEHMIAGGVIRGIGPDVIELDADLPPEMTGAPVFSLDSGKVIGFVAPQLDGVTTDWARGTRHEDARVFVARLDRVGEGRTIPISRFANEAAYIDRFLEENHDAWLAYMLLEYGKGGYPPHIDQNRPGQQTVDYRKKHADLMKEIRKEAAGKTSNPHIVRALRWADGGLEDRAFILRQIADALRIQRDLTSEFTWYHAQLYRDSVAARNAGIRAMRDSANRIRN